jgi:hypothetical protein
MAMAERFRFTKDDDGHTYLIPADKEEAFDAWLEHQQKLWGESHTDEEFKKLDAEYQGEDFNDYRVDGSVTHYTFENPQEGQRG